jgi:hypothetical protein
MEPSLDREREQAHALLDLLPAEKLNAVLSLLEVMVEPLKHWTAPMRRSLAAKASPTRRSSVSST